MVESSIDDIQNRSHPPTLASVDCESNSKVAGDIKHPPNEPDYFSCLPSQEVSRDPTGSTSVDESALVDRLPERASPTESDASSPSPASSGLSSSGLVSFGQNVAPGASSSLPINSNSYTRSRSRADSPDVSNSSISSDTVVGLQRPGQLSAANRSNTRPVLKRFYSLPSNPNPSPARHHFRLANPGPHLVKETPTLLMTEDPASGLLHINQYLLQKAVGQGSYGMVYRAVDPSTGTIYAIKTCSKMRLAKLNRHALMQERRRNHLKAPSSAKSSGFGGATSELIRREIAVMKKIDHPNLVTLYEVIDDPCSDSLYLVLEWCENGTIMPAESQYDGKANPLEEDQCRLYFRDMILGVEYLHEKGISHRDIKADNVMLGDDDVVKLADFGVSEIFDTTGDPHGDSVRRCVGSPAYMAPELVRLNRGSLLNTSEFTINKDKLDSVSGRKTDIWAMGVTLYYMLHGKLPFEADNLGQLFDRILHDPLKIDQTRCSESLTNLLCGLLDRNPSTRIKMCELREHSWVTNEGTDKLLPREENVQSADSDDAITEEDLASAIEQLQLANHEHTIDINDLAKTLRTEYGWRGSGNATVQSSRRPSPSRMDSTDSEKSVVSDNSGKMDKLVRALDEILRIRWWASGNENSTSASRTNSSHQSQDSQDSRSSQVSQTTETSQTSQTSQASQTSQTSQESAGSFFQVKTQLEEDLESDLTETPVTPVTMEEPTIPIIVHPTD